MNIERSVGIESFRDASSGWLSREIEGEKQGASGSLAIRQSSSSRLQARVAGWFASPTAEQRALKAESRAQVKQQFMGLLAKTEGKIGAERALSACGLPPDFGTNKRPLTNHTVRQILDAAQQYRMKTVASNEKLLARSLEGLSRIEDRDLRSAISREVKNRADFGSRVFSADDISMMRQKAQIDFEVTRGKLCEERFPNLSNLVAKAPAGSGLKEVVRDPAKLSAELRPVASAIPERLLAGATVSESLTLIDSATELLGRQAWNQGTLMTLSDELSYCRTDIQRASEGLALESAKLLDSLAALGQDDPQVQRVQEALDFCNALHDDLDHHIDLLDAKSTYVDEMRATDPLTNRSVSHSNLLASHCCAALLDDLQMDARLTQAQKEKLSSISDQWSDKVLSLKGEYDRSGDLDKLQSIVAGSKAAKADHPVVTGKREVIQSLKTLLESAGIPKETLKATFSKESMARSERTALSRIDTWQPVDRNMVVMRDGVMRVYKSQITPAQYVHSSLGQSIAGSDLVGGVSAGVKDSESHARNLKVSRLVDPQGKAVSTVIGHGVLDMWEVKGAEARSRANNRGAKEVLELALSSNDRLRSNALSQDPTAAAPRLVHVSVNLISPDTVREWIPTAGARDYKERTYTFNQFKAFDANSGPGQVLRVFDPATPSGEPKSARVDVDAITFSFGINALATGWKESIMNVWSNVHEHNTANMIKLVGDLGEGGFGSRGTRPGGFVGEVYDRLERFSADMAADPADRAQAADLMSRLRGQTDLVRSMFTEETFKRGNGDTAKMGREVLVLQGLAEQGLQVMNATDLAGTSSRGCKSDKDRGGVTDVELKSKLILRDLGGEMNPDEALVGDDQGVYYTVSASSGQLENQRFNTGLAGSKEAGHLKHRLPDPEVRQFLSGLGAFTKA